MATQTGGGGQKPPGGGQVASAAGGDNPQRGIGGKGWRGDQGWRDAVKMVGKGGTIDNIGGQVPTQEEAETLIKESGGKVVRTEGPHDPPNPHTYDHINYTTESGTKGTIQIQPPGS